MIRKLSLILRSLPSNRLNKVHVLRPHYNMVFRTYIALEQRRIVAAYDDRRITRLGEEPASHGLIGLTQS